MGLTIVWEGQALIAFAEAFKFASGGGLVHGVAVLYNDSQSV